MSSIVLKQKVINWAKLIQLYKVVVMSMSDMALDVIIPTSD